VRAYRVIMSGTGATLTSAAARSFARDPEKLRELTGCHCRGTDTAGVRKTDIPYLVDVTTAPGARMGGRFRWRRLCGIYCAAGRKAGVRSGSALGWIFPGARNQALPCPGAPGPGDDVTVCCPRADEDGASRTCAEMAVARIGGPAEGPGVLPFYAVDGQRRGYGPRRMAGLIPGDLTFWMSTIIWRIRGVLLKLRTGKPVV
jgi:hypothetical protein